MKYLYKYPQARYPYEELVDESINRGRDVNEYEITDTDSFDDGRYWDVFVEVRRAPLSLSFPLAILSSPLCLRPVLFHQYAKDEEGPDGISIRITAYNRGPEPADLHIIPQLWFRNTWSWPKDEPVRPKMSETAEGTIQVDHETLGRTHLYCSPSPAPAAPADGGVVLVDGPSVVPELLFTENDTNFEVRTRFS